MKPSFLALLAVWIVLAATALGYAQERNYSVASIDSGPVNLVQEKKAPRASRPGVQVAYQCGRYNDPNSTQCAGNQNCCRNHEAANPYNYCCPSFCGSFGTCR
jgi:hypothetical protein